MVDKWVWVGENNKPFSTQSVRKVIQDGVDYGSNFVLKWVSWVPLKCSIMVWRAEMNMLPTKMELVKRNVDITNTLCSWCDHCEETTIHVLADCIIASNVWDRISSWCGLDPIYAFKVKDFLGVYKTVKGDKMRRKIVHGLIMVTLWSLWVTRNDTIFNGKKPNVGDIVAKIKSISFLWLKNRSNCNRLLWEDWVRSPLYML
ncbi:reverse transcriptase zinc-binding domain-containing protein [Artemisia annua]|uniref:Reverse transcriptase zinc-binding domain-containing protein n=1 Tax=Artemisia annua TaxID=35608 RepID=A0A2U1ME77_ARTAN|nr:reverse transcriptase zinc-binding domain-containing protein [Artemisia annua]